MEIEISQMLYFISIGIIIGWYWFGNGYKKTEQIVDSFINDGHWIMKKVQHLQIKVIKN